MKLRKTFLFMLYNIVLSLLEAFFSLLHAYARTYTYIQTHTYRTYIYSGGQNRGHLLGKVLF